jgi:hypothetical protein
MEYIRPVGPLLTTPLAAGALALPAVAGDGVDISTWRQQKSQWYYDAATVYLIATAAATLGDVNNPVFLCGFRNAAWWIAGLIDGGAPIVFPAGGLRQARRVGDVGIFSKLAIACAALGGTTYQYMFEPIAQDLST